MTTTSSAAEPAVDIRAVPDEQHDPPPSDFESVYSALWAPITRFAPGAGRAPAVNPR